MWNAGTSAWTRLTTWWNQRYCNATHECAGHGQLRCGRHREHAGDHSDRIHEWNDTGVWFGSSPTDPGGEASPCEGTNAP